MSLSRRTIVTSAAALPALAVPAIGGADPVLLKLAACRKAWAEFRAMGPREPTDNNASIAGVFMMKLWRGRYSRHAPLMQRAALRSGRRERRRHAR
jgi:hypothetical protein